MPSPRVHTGGGARGLGAAPLALLLLVLLVAPGGAATAPGRSDGPSTGPGPMELTVPGLAPDAASLIWGASTDTLFADYQVERSTTGANGSWSSIATITSITATSYFVSGLTPGTTYWWRVVEDSLLAIATASNVVEAGQPAVAGISATLSGATEVSLAWTNNATYGGAVAFSEYDVLLGVGNGTFANRSVVTDAATRSTIVGGLAPATTYRFVVRTVDRCSGADNCGTPAQVTASSSAVASATTPTALTATVVLANATATVGTPVALSCSGGGGRAPYAVAWSFGDGTSGSGSSTSHVYAAAGVFEVRCAVTDSWGTTANATAQLTVNATAGSGGSGSGGNGSGGSGGGSGGGTGGGSSGGGNGSGGSGSGGSGGGTPPSGGGPPTFPSPGPASTAPGSLVPTLAMVLFVLLFLAAVGWLALFARRRRSVRPATPPSAAGPPPGPAPPPPPPAAPMSAGSGGSDLDHYLDELDGIEAVG